MQGEEIRARISFGAETWAKLGESDKKYIADRTAEDGTVSLADRATGTWIAIPLRLISRCLPGSLWRGDQDAPELLKLRKDKNKSEKVHGRMQAFGNNNERSQRSGAKRKRQACGC